MIGDKTPRFPDNFFGEADGLPLGVFGDVSGKKKSDALAAIVASVFDAAFILSLVACAFWGLVFFLFDFYFTILSVVDLS